MHFEVDRLTIEKHFAPYHYLLLLVSDLTAICITNVNLYFVHIELGYEHAIDVGNLLRIERRDCHDG